MDVAENEVCSRTKEGGIMCIIACYACWCNSLDFAFVVYLIHTEER